MTACQEALATCLEMVKADTVADRKERACLENKEPTSDETESAVVHEEVFKEEAAVKTVRALKKWYGDPHLDIGHC